VVGEVRREEQKEEPQLKRVRYVWIRNPDRLRKWEAERLAELLPESDGAGLPVQMTCSSSSLSRFAAPRSPRFRGALLAVPIHES
jgi:hypothetical protein